MFQFSDLPKKFLRKFQNQNCLISSSPMAGRAITSYPLTTQSIPSLFRDGMIVLARQTFDEMPEKDIVAYSSMIYGYSKQGLFTESLQLFSHLQRTETQPNSFTFVALLLTSAGLRNSKLSECIHGTVVKNGLNSDLFVRTAMLDSYAKCGSIVSAHSLFMEMVEPHLVTYSTMMSAFLHNDLVDEALLLFKQLRAFGLVPNCATMISAVQSSTAYGSFGLCESLHGYIAKVGFDYDIPVMNSVFDMYLSWGDVQLANDCFRKMVVLDVVTWTRLMGFLVEKRWANEVFTAFIMMRACRVNPDRIAMVNLITACALLGDCRRGRSVHSYIVASGIGLDLFIVNSLISLYCKCLDLDSARTLFERMVGRSLVSWTALISGYGQNNQPIEALRLLMRLRREEYYDIDSVTLVSLVASSSERANLELCSQLHSYGFKLGLIQQIPVQNSLVSAYGKCGSADQSFKVFEEMNHRNSISWNAMISSYGINGEGDKAVNLFVNMEKCGEEPDSYTYSNVLTACSHSGLVDIGLAIFERMVREQKVAPRGEHWGCVVDMLARAGRLEEATELVKSMEGIGENVWKTLLAACCTNGDVGMAEMIAGRLFRIGSEDSGPVVLLSNVYASVGRFDKVEALRSSIGLNGLVKNTGISSL